MKFKMNNRNWEIKEMTQDKMREIVNDTTGNGRYFGLCCYDKQLIILDKDLHVEQKRETLIHELVHCYIGCYISFESMEWTEDSICNLVGNSHDIIHQIVEKYFKKVLTN